MNFFFMKKFMNFVLKSKKIHQKSIIWKSLFFIDTGGWANIHNDGAPTFYYSSGLLMSKSDPAYMYYIPLP